MYNYPNTFYYITLLLKLTPNLRSLTISSNNRDMIDACRWEYLITSLLPRLAVFRFKFGVSNVDDILRIFEQFQSDFWLQQHHWYTEYTRGVEICRKIKKFPRTRNHFPQPKFFRNLAVINNFSKNFPTRACTQTADFTPLNTH